MHTAVFTMAILSLFAVQAGHGATPQDALHYVIPNLDLTQQRLDYARANLPLSRQLEYSIKLQPDVNYTDIFDDDAQATFTPNFSGELELGYRYDQVQNLNMIDAVNNTELELIRLRRNGIRDALLAHAELLRAQVSERRAQFDLSAAQAGEKDSQIRFTAGELDEYDVMSAELVLNQAQLTYERSFRQLKGAQSTASRYGLEGPALYRTVEFALPERALESTETFKDYELAVSIADAELLQATVFNSLETIELDVGYSTASGRIGSTVGIADNLPGAGVTFTYPSGEANGWEISLNTEIVLDQDLSFISIDQLDLNQAKRSLEDYSRAFSQNYALYREDVAFARRRLQLAKRLLELNHMRRTVLNTEILELKNALKAANKEKQPELQVLIEGVESDTTNVVRDKYSLETTLYETWTDYIRSVDSYLTLIDGSWALTKEAGL